MEQRVKEVLSEMSNKISPSIFPILDFLLKYCDVLDPLPYALCPMPFASLSKGTEGNSAGVRDNTLIKTNFHNVEKG